MCQGFSHLLHLFVLVKLDKQHIKGLMLVSPNPNLPINPQGQVGMGILGQNPVQGHVTCVMQNET